MSGGGMFGMGKSEQQASGWNQADSSSTSMSVGGGQSTSGQSVFGADTFSKLYSDAGMAAGSTLAQGPQLADIAKQLFTGGSSFLQGLGNDAGTGYLQSRVSGDSGVADSEIAQLQSDTGHLFTDQFNPAITAQAVAGGTLGGGRQGVAQGAAMDSLARTFSSQAAQIRVSDQAQRDAAATTIAGNSLGAASTGLGALPSLLGLVQSGQNNNLDILGKFSAILGGPTTLSSSQSSQFSQSIADAISKSFGTSESSGHAWNFQAAGQGGMG
jgi:hypothetical protein